MFLLTVISGGDDFEPPAIEMCDSLEEAVGSAKDYIVPISKNNAQAWPKIKEGLFAKRTWESDSPKVRVDIKEYGSGINRKGGLRP